MRTDPQFIKLIVVALSLAVMAAGIAREAFVLEFGVGTLLQDLRQFDLDSENSVPAWWSSSLMLLAALMLYRLGAEARPRGDRLWLFWVALAAAFFLLSIDEAASFHEGVIEPLKAAFGFGGALYYAWVVPAVICLVVFGLLLLPLLQLVPTGLKWRLVICGAIFVTGALGMEMVGGWLDFEGLRPTPVYALVTTVEEGLEILGLSLFLSALLDQFDPNRAVVGIRAVQRAAAAQPPVPHLGQYPVAAE